jgi:hypothetical protein
VDQFADLALAVVGHGIVVGREALVAGFDSSWSHYLPSSLYRHARR